MKKKSSADKVCEPITEYDLDLLLPQGIQGKYVERYRMGTNLVLLEPDVAAAFPDQESVNKALRLVMQLSGITVRDKVPRNCQSVRRTQHATG